MSNMKWHDELDVFRKIKSCIILEGNVFDRFHYPGDPKERMRELPDYLYCFLYKCGYKAVATYDPSKGFFSEYSPSGMEMIARFCSGIKNAKLADGIIKCAFTGGSLSGSESFPPIGEMLAAILEQPNEKPKVPAAVIVDMASRLIVSPDDIAECEVKAFASIQRALRKAKNTLANNENTKNLVVLVVNKVNDLPAWFYLNNPDIKTIHIATPDSNARRDFISGDSLEFFFHPEIWERDQRVVQETPEKIKKLVNQFVGLTDGFTFSDMVGMRVLCTNERYGVLDLPKVVDFYRYGIRENKWNSVNRDIVSALESDLTNKLIGQDLAKEKVLDVVKRSIVQKRGNNRPKGVLFFAGPTGTGKTETAKLLAQNIFGDQSCCIRFDMSEYRQEHSDQKLLGAPPGYVGYEAGGQLTNAVRNNPFSILLFDEIEKAHPSIMDKFLQILDDGRLTDGQGNTVYFSESIIIFTSNKGILDEVEERDQFGIVRFVNKQVVNPDECNPDEVQRKVVASIKEYFKFKLGRPELLNRIGENNIVVFDFIREDAARRILKNQIETQLDTFRSDLEIQIVISDPVMESLMSAACSAKVLENGGRGIRNMVESMLYTPITRFIYDHDVSAGQVITINRLSVGSSPSDPVVLDAEVTE